MRASEITRDANISILMKGAPGYGKTLAAASFALLGPTYIAYFDKKKPIELLTFFTEKRFGTKARKILDNIEYDIFGGSNAHEYLNKIISLAKDCRYSTVITDSVTNLTASAVNWSLGFRDSKGKKDKLNKDAPAMIPDFDEYKVETSLVSQALDLQKSFPCNIIWTAHPLPSIKVEGSGASIKVTKTNPIVTYGSKVAGMIPGNFTEIYHFSQLSSWDANTGRSNKRYVVNLEAIGDEYAKSPLLGDFVKELDMTDRLFYEVWKEAIDASMNVNTETGEEATLTTTAAKNPFANQPTNSWKV